MESIVFSRTFHIVAYNLAYSEVWSWWLVGNEIGEIIVVVDDLWFSGVEMCYKTSDNFFGRAEFDLWVVENIIDIDV